MSRRKKEVDPLETSRREFLWKGACAALTTTGIATTIRDLRLMNAATAQTVPTNYKALVCLFLFGGNDGNNLIIPTDATRYAQYNAPTNARGVLALSAPGTASDSILPITTNNQPSNQTYGIHPNCPELAALTGTAASPGPLAVLANVGTLLGPITKAQYQAGSAYVPPQIFSHPDQQIQWQTSLEDQPPKTGWGGRSADLLYTLNNNNAVSMNISLSGANTLQVGNTINEYSVSPSGAVSLNLPNNTVGNNQLAALKALISMNHTNLYESAFATEMNTSLTDATTLNAAIAPTAGSYFTTPFTTSSLGSQLKMIARLIQAAPVLGHNRQIFFASVGGYDLHYTEGTTLTAVPGSPGAQAVLLSDLSANMNALYQATVQMNVASSVTQFTASDFCRTFPVNGGNGADHGWGNHHLILGGAVKGGNLYGTFPTLVVGGANDTTTGRWIPTTSVDQYAATLATWFGVSSTNLDAVFPYLYRFQPAGFQYPYTAGVSPLLGFL
jgi:uncharacterized protein (DUF1501 family)